MCGFSNEENMLRLRKCLKGRALEAVRCRLLHPSNVAGVLSTLKMLYGRPEAIVQAVIKKIRSLPSPSIEKLETVVNFALTVENLVATIQACEVSDFVYNASLRYELVGRLPPTLKLSWARFSRNNPTPNLLDFSTWLYETVEDASAVVDTVFSDQRFRGTKRDGFLNVHSEIDSKDSKPANSPQKPTIVDTKKCVACKGDCTMLAKCKQFVDLSYDSKWATVRAYKLCRKCLRKHNGSCRQEKPCGTNGCTYLHHPLLHGYGNPRSGESPTAAAVYEKSCNVHQVQSEILFRVVPVILYGPSKAIRTYAFLDDGSELTLLEQSLADELGLRGPKNPLCLKWTGETTKIENRSQNVSLQISSVTNPIKRYDLSSVRTIRNLQIRPQTLLTSELQQRYQHLMGLPIESYNEANPRILIGLDNATLGYAMKSREGQSNEPIAIKTRLGWIVFGSCVGEKNAGHYVNYHALQICQCNRETGEDLHELVKGYFALDSLGISKQSKLLLSHEDQRAQSMLESLTRPVDSRFESGLLWKYDSVRLPDSAAMALRRWRCLDNRMKKDPLLAGELNAKIQDHINKGYIRKLSAEELEVNRPRVWYLPIFPIVNPNKPGKTRLVWDAAATAFGVSLNSVLLTGPDQLTSLLSVLIQFREFRTAVCGDIREMYHQVRMREDDQHCQRFFWKACETDIDPSVYVVQVMTFGACCSPSTAQYVKNYNAKRFEQEHPEAVHAIVKQHYVDDMLLSVESEEEAIQVVREVQTVHRSAGFEMRNWISNSPRVVAAMSETGSDEKSLSIGDKHVSERVLGMWWNTSTDCFTYKMSPRYEQLLISGQRRPTKREVLRTLMMIFDPLGFIAHFLMQLKSLLQEIWRTSVGWDDPIDESLFQKWLSWLTVLPQVSSIEIPRCYRTLTSATDGTVVQLHTFVDASENGFAAAVYLRFQEGETIECRLAGAKTRVAPLKFLSIPKSELQAAVIGVKLAGTIAKSLSVKINQRFFWTDSRDVLCWLNSDHRRYSQFVAFRVSEILETTNVNEWQWVPTKLNVADEGTKWTRAPDMTASSRWFCGPNFLWQPKKAWPVSPHSFGSTKEELRPHLLLHTMPLDPVVQPHDFSEWSSLLRRMAYVTRFVDNLRQAKMKKPRQSGPLTRDELRKAENYLFRLAQRSAYPDEIAVLNEPLSTTQQRKFIKNNSSLSKMRAFLDKNGVLRARGRTQECKFTDYDAANPVILPRNHHITRLIVSNAHKQFNHQNHETIINELRQRFRSPRLKATYRAIRKECQQCKNNQAAPQPPAMADLPLARLAAFARPFTYMGIDYFGPMTVSVGRRTEKR
ncbi:uncharacterized protein LOC131687846 [Topomyia yanbarensis]|uniref:uncharacterized protein LOC131687846 n=1 Tax=Topomyia yanbarensis TaxID=2498891 RepID=UPI00273AE182|nr:uncharacterized protein LOC131687846 [Topomyia yanbarensis]